jgi:hypothetical protein
MAFVFAGLMLGSALALITPPSGAAPGDNGPPSKGGWIESATATPSCNNPCRHAVDGPNTYNIAKIGDTISTTVSGWVTSDGCTPQSGVAPSVFVDVDFTAVDGSHTNQTASTTANSTTNPFDTAGYTFTATISHQLLPANLDTVGTANPLVTIPLGLFVRCGGSLAPVGSFTMNRTATSGAPIVIDVTPPTTAFTLATTGTGGFGTTTFSITGPTVFAKNPVESVTFDLSQINSAIGTITTGGTLTQIQQNLTKYFTNNVTTNTGVPFPKAAITVTDTSGNVLPADVTYVGHALDLKAPGNFPGPLALDRAAPPGINITYQVPTGSEYTNLSVNLTDITLGASYLVECDYQWVVTTFADGCGLVVNATSQANKSVVFGLRPTAMLPLMPDHVYQATVALHDGVNNSNAWTQTGTVHTWPNPTASVEVLLPPGKTVAAVGDTVTLVPIPSSISGTNHDTYKIVADTSAFSSQTSPFWIWTASTNSWNYTTPATVTIQNTSFSRSVSASVLPIPLYGNTTFGYGNVVDANGNPFAVFPIDPRAPDVITNEKLTPLTGGAIKVEFTPPADADVDHYVLHAVDTTTNTPINADQSCAASGCTWTHAPDDHVYQISVAGVDTAGNQGQFNTNPPSAPSSANPDALLVTTPQGTYSLPPVVAGTWSGATIPAGTTNLTMTFQSAPNNTAQPGKYWTAQSGAAAWSSSPYVFYGTLQANGQFSVDNFTRQANASALASLPEGFYNVQLTLTDSPHNIAFPATFSYTLNYNVAAHVTPIAGAGSPPVIKGFGNFSGPWTGSVVPATTDATKFPTGTNVTVALVRNDTGGTKYWTGAAPTSTSDPFTSTPKWMGAWAYASNGTWVSWNLTSGFGAESANAAKLPSGSSYALAVQIQDPTHGITSTDFYPFILDRDAPAIDTTATSFSIVPSAASPTQYMQGFSTLVVQTKATDAGTGLTGFTYTLKRADGSAAPTVAGGVASVSCPSAACSLSPPLSAGALGYWGNATITMATPVSGDFALIVNATDGAQNVGTSPSIGTVNVRPRVAIDLNNPPTVDATNNMTIAIYAAIDRSDADGGTSCAVRDVCKVSQVQILARTRGSGAAGTPLGTVTFPFSSLPSRAYDPNGPLMYDYTPNGRVSLGGFDRNNTEVSAVATATDAAGNTVTSPTTWIQVSTTDQILSGLTILAPSDNATTVMPNASNAVNVSIRFDRANVAGQPRLLYWLNNTLAHSTVTAASCAASPNADGTLSQGPTYYFNTTAGCEGLQSHAGTFPSPGEYTLEVRALSADNATFYKWAGRFFGLEQLGPVISFPQSMQTDVVPGNFAPRVFNVSANVRTGYANLTASGVRLTLRGESALPTDASVSLGSLVVTQDPTTHVKDYNLTAHVVLPGAAVDGNRFSVSFNVSTDGYATGGFAANMSQSPNFVLDLLPPAGNVSVADSQATVVGGIANEQILGVSSDTESGTKRVDVNLYDVDLDQTFAWDAGPGAPSGTFVSGDTGDFMTSDLVRVPGTPYYVRNVWLQQAGGVHNDQTLWSVNDSNRQIFSSAGATTGATFNRIGIDPGHLYRVRVRMVDALGHVSLAETTLRLDAQAPSLTTAFAVPGNGAIPGVGAEDWPIQANVTDNWCVGRVILHGLSPLTQTSQSADFAAPSGYSCVGHPGPASQWVLHLADAPQMRYEPGVWSYWLEVRDTAGNNVTTAHQPVYVQDDMAPVVRNVTLEPATVGEGSSARIVADVLENWRVANVSATITRQGSSTVLASGALSADDNDPPAANGTGRYLVDLQSDFHLNLTLGTYTVTVKALDGNRSSAACPECVLGSATLHVVTEAPPDVRFDRPGDTATYVNASPSISLRITGKNLTTSGVTIRAGTSPTALVTVTPTLAFQPGSEGTVLLATFDQGPLAAGDNLTVDVSVTTSSGFSGHAARTWAVDATPPTANATVAGDLVLNGVDWLGRGATITLTADDGLSGVAARTYSVNGGAQQTYRAPITVTPLDGPFALVYGATDRAGNAATPRTLTATVDATGPAMSVLQAGASVNVTVNDHGVGLDNASVRLYYRLQGGSVFANVAMQQVSGTSVFTATPPGDLSAGYAYYVVASDLLHNDNSDGTADSPHAVAATNGGGGGTANTPPTVKINQPANGDSVRGSVDVQYLARDAETAAEQLKVTISLRGVTTNQVLVTDGANDGSYALNASGLPAGAYTLVVRASDGDLAGTDSVTFTVEAGPAVETTVPPPASVNADSPVNFAVKFNPTGKTVVQATWTAYKDGALYTSGVLTAGSGQYGAVFTPKDAGTYTIKVQATYNDGTTDPQATQVAAFDVAPAPGGGGAAGGGTPASFLVLVGLAAATIALAGYGAFVRWRK